MTRSGSVSTGNVRVPVPSVWQPRNCQHAAGVRANCDHRRTPSSAGMLPYMDDGRGHVRHVEHSWALLLTQKERVLMLQQEEDETDADSGGYTNPSDENSSYTYSTRIRCCRPQFWWRQASTKYSIARLPPSGTLLPLTCFNLPEPLPRNNGFASAAAAPNGALSISKKAEMQDAGPYLDPDSEA
ncbi:hypothetical protein M440DRAFT_1389414 [Trichoderma longibrachiatum ATCC 18648]|uniref:Uncharacterized protein n=1 Tax=Trichoderma longibrachiatum ATCC 18648 TaxID=983965 RepID=A0A2T4CCX4_TRILO|nr:hypothetical protein M440DRAFT_1389414 [Trichoderma longibrachiatum ATCC 18648]